ncbi:MAG: BsuPI-related putative proteinase inhibitor [Gemmatimonadaceae bacterium]
MRRVGVIPLLLVAAGLGCSTAPTEPPALPEAGGLRLDGSISLPTIRLGQQAVLTFRLRNLTEEAIRLNFGSGCQITPFIETASGRSVYPSGGGYGCTTALTSLTLAPRGDHSITMEVVGDGIRLAIYTGYPLPEGRYRAYAILEGNSTGIQLRSDYVRFEVR